MEVEHKSNLVNIEGTQKKDEANEELQDTQATNKEVQEDVGKGKAPCDTNKATQRAEEREKNAKGVKQNKDTSVSNTITFAYGLPWKLIQKIYAMHLITKLCLQVQPIFIIKDQMHKK